MSNHELSVLFFLQLAVILLAVRLAGSLARKIGQPAVIGEYERTPQSRKPPRITANLGTQPLSQQLFP